MRNRAIGRGPFDIRFTNGNNIVEVWDGQPDHPESEFILSISVLLIPALIATLTSIKVANQ